MGKLIGQDSQETWVLMQGLLTPEGLHPTISQASVALLET